MTNVLLSSTTFLSAPDPLPALRHAYRMRDEYQRAELRLNNQLKALQRRLGQGAFDTHAERAEVSLEDGGSNVLTEHLKQHRDELAVERKRWEKNLSVLAKTLEVWPWAQGVRGVGPLSLGQIVAETGDLGLYANPAKVWKRMGLAVFEGR